MQNRETFSQKKSFEFQDFAKTQATDHTNNSQKMFDFGRLTGDYNKKTHHNQRKGFIKVFSNIKKDHPAQK